MKDGRYVVVELFEGSMADGGAETLVKDYCLLFDKSVFEPVVLVDWIIKKSANYRRLRDSGVRIISLYPSYSIFWRGFNKFFRERFVNWKIGKVLEKLHPDIIHVHLDALKRLEANKDKLSGVKLFYTCHNEPWFYFDNMPDEDRACRMLIKDYGLRLIALRDDMAETLNKKFGVDNTVVIKNGINLERFRNPVKTRQEVRRELGIPSSAFLVGHIGRFSEQKNHAFLLDVFAALKKKRPDAFLLLVGTGDLEGEIRKKIHFLSLDGSVVIVSHREDIPEILNAIDSFVFPSLFEGLGIVLVEAQASGVKCVVSDKVNSEVYLSPLVVPLSLDASLESWVDAVLDDSVRGTYPDRLSEYDIREEVRKLERLYKGTPDQDEDDNT